MPAIGILPMLYRTEELAALIAEGRPMLIAGAAEQMRLLPRGNWIGGTTPFILGAKGGLQVSDMLFASVMPRQARIASIQRYGVGGLHLLPEDMPENGFSVVIMPAGTLVQQTFAKEAPSYPGIFSKALSGWVSGSRAGHFGGRPQVFFGPSALCMEDEAVAIHLELPPGLRASVEMINVYEPRPAPVIRFPSEGFTTTHAIVDGELVVFAEYLNRIKANIEVPLLANYGGTRINVGIRGYDLPHGQVSFYGPVFRNVNYHFAQPVPNMKQKIMDFMPKDGRSPVFSCVCISNYTQGMMEDFPAGAFEGPVAFGEIAHLLVNQTMTYLRIVNEDGTDI